MLASCGSVEIPEQYTTENCQPPIFPDYGGATIPCNISPLNFMLSDTSITEVSARLKNGSGMEITAGGKGREVQYKPNEWRQMLEASKGGCLTLELYAAGPNHQWKRYPDSPIYVADSKIDPYISYRLIEPAYSIYEDMCLAQRCLETHSESVIHSSKIAYGQCVNCHSYQNYNPERMLFHKRVSDAGTVIRIDGHESTVDLKRPNTISAGVYPSWHPRQKLVAFSTDKTHQMFHTQNLNKVEVYDTESDLILYDVDSDQVSVITSTPDILEVFPTWSPCGSFLYYCSARLMPGTFKDGDNIDNHTLIKYDILRLGFDTLSRTFARNADTIYSASAKGKSATLPRLSPDGSKLIFAEGGYGCFHIWHHDSQIRILDLKTGAIDSLETVNSPEYADSYPSFSSNGEWIMLASRRGDGQFSRIYISYYDGKKAHKPFLLPQESAWHNVMRLKSYNRPEFMTGPVR